MICLANVMFATSKARQFGPYGSGHDTEEEATIAMTMKSMNEMEFLPTHNGQYLSDIKPK